MKMLRKRNIVVFDFDGTLSASDSNYEFFKYCFAHSLRPWVFLPCVLVGVFGSLLNIKGVWWRETIRNFITPKMVQNFSSKFIKQHKKKRFDWVQDVVNQEKAAGNMVVVVSASPNYLVPGLVEDLHFDGVVCSKMKQDKPYKYKFLCWGENKVVALDKWAMKHKIIPNVVRVYSDSLSDMPLMNISKERVWIDKKTGLRK